ncbi:MAG: hypothetical protein ACI8P9_004227 [Parasphingorhabdus sp.]|jgi:hypothetical protein
MSKVSVNSDSSIANNKLWLSAQVRHRAVGEDGVLVHLQNGRVIVVNEIGLYIVHLLQKPISTVAISESISAEFDVTLQQAESDMIKFLAELDHENIIERATPADYR